MYGQKTERNQMAGYQSKRVLLISQITLVKVGKRKKNQMARKPYDDYYQNIN